MQLSRKTRKDINSREEFIDYYLRVVEYRERNKARVSSDKIALQVFNDIHQNELSFNLGEDLERVRYEMGALSAPGVPDDQEANHATYEDELWNRLREIILSIKSRE